jgi:hypothetical protein
MVKISCSNSISNFALCESWTIKARDTNRVQSVEMWCLRRGKERTRLNYITFVDVRTELKIQPVQNKVY